ncbi:uncharacterized protein LOC129586081 [Paramacrobiotus metropolitanus]|uniref:uncharacterized protein LOC129586081 n=1 Tax=Paramacrobiotus metropolitanus TaxID=2943436 RepID=UPI002445A730|nr:uncharacterized protein LOC129586081 [Paramacrobiotus metropolitanus]
MSSHEIQSLDHVNSSPFCEIYPDTDIYQWNAVDVENAEGFLERGLVTNTVNGGLLIDFGVADRRSQLIELERALHCCCSGHEFCAATHSWGLDYHWASRNEEPLGGFEVLTRTAADRPWMWYPAVFLARRILWNKYAYIGIRLGENVVAKFVSPLVVRLAQRYRGERAVDAKDYVTQVCALPREYLEGRTVEPELWSIWVDALKSAYASILYPIGVNNECLLYLQDGIGPSKLTPILTEVLNRLNLMAKSELTRRLQAGWTFADGKWIPENVELSTRGPLYPTTAQPSSPLADAFPPELFQEILSCFGTNERPFYRRVSPLWNELFHQDDIRQRLTLNFRDAGTAAYSMGMSIIKHLTAATELVVINNARQSMTMQEFGDCMLLIGAVYKQSGNSLQKLQVMAYRCRWDLGDERFSSEVELLARTCVDVAAAVESIQWRNCLFSGCGPLRDDNTVALDVTATHETLREMETDLRALLMRQLWYINRPPIPLRWYHAL